MIGDRDHDVEGALLNGIDCIGVTWGFGDTAELEGAGAAAVVDAPEKLCRPSPPRTVLFGHEHRNRSVRARRHAVG